MTGIRTVVALAFAVLLAVHTVPTYGQPSSRTLVAVFAHADDETSVAPVLARYAREGARVHLIIATDGAQGGSNTDIRHTTQSARVLRGIRNAWTEVNVMNRSGRVPASRRDGLAYAASLDTSELRHGVTRDAAVAGRVGRIGALGNLRVLRDLRVLGRPLALLVAIGVALVTRGDTTMISRRELDRRMSLWP